MYHYFVSVTMDLFLAGPLGGCAVARSHLHLPLTCCTAIAKHVPNHPLSEGRRALRKLQGILKEPLRHSILTQASEKNDTQVTDHPVPLVQFRALDLQSANHPLLNKFRLAKPITMSLLALCRGYQSSPATHTCRRASTYMHCSWSSLPARIALWSPPGTILCLLHSHWYLLLELSDLCAILPVMHCMQSQAQVTTRGVIYTCAMKHAGNNVDCIHAGDL